MNLLHKFPDKLLAEVLVRGKCFHCEEFKYENPDGTTTTKKKFFICLSDFDATRQKVPIAICTSQTDQSQMDHCIQLSSYPFFPVQTYVNMLYLQFLSFSHFKERSKVQAVGPVGEISEVDMNAIVEKTKTMRMPTNPKKREEWQAILLLIRDDLSIDFS